MRFRVGHQHSCFMSILTRFVDYYSLFCGPIVISRIYEPHGAFTCPSSTVEVLADSDPFRGLLLIWGPEAICIVAKPQGALTCRLSALVVLADSGLFHGLFLTVLGSRIDFQY